MLIGLHVRSSIKTNGVSRECMWHTGRVLVHAFCMNMNIILGSLPPLVCPRVSNWTLHDDDDDDDPTKSP